jgi:Recombination endonuclease VII
MTCDDENKKKKRKRKQESERARQRYAEDADYRTRKLASNDAYQNEHRDEIAARQRENRASCREKDRKRYAEDPQYRARTLAKNMAFYWRHCDELNARRREKRSSDAEFRERLLERQNERRHALVYGLSKEDYRRLLAAQNGLCAVCDEKPERRLCVDHCHATGEVRGLLCGNCNTAIGLLADDPERMLAAARYVRRGRRAAPARTRRAPDIPMTGACRQMPMPGAHASIGLVAQAAHFGLAGPAIAS